MDNGENQDPKTDVGERISRLIRANQRAHKKEIAAEELQNLKTAASRLDQILKNAADAETQSLKHAAAKLDQLLNDIRAGKDLTTTLKKREAIPNEGMREPE